MPVSDADLDAIFKQGVSVSYYAGLRACWDAGWNSANSITPTAASTDPSTTTATDITVADTITTP